MTMPALARFPDVTIAARPHFRVVERARAERALKLVERDAKNQQASEWRSMLPDVWTPRNFATGGQVFTPGAVLPQGLASVLNAATTIGTPVMTPFQGTSAAPAATEFFSQPAQVAQREAWAQAAPPTQTYWRDVAGGGTSTPSMSALETAGSALALGPQLGLPAGMPTGADGVDYSAAPAGSLRERLEQQRQGESQYGTIPQRVAENPLEFAALLALGMAAPIGIARASTIPVLGTGIRLLGGMAAGQLGSAAVQKAPGFELLPEPLQRAATIAPYFAAGPGSAALKASGVGTSVAGGMAAEALGGDRETGEFIGGFAGGIPSALTRGAIGAIRNQIISRKAEGILDDLARSTDEADLIARLKNMDPMDLLEVNEAVMRTNPELAKSLGAAIAAARAGDQQAAAKLKGALYGEATTLSRRVAQMTGEAPQTVRQRAVGKVAEGLSKIAGKGQIASAIDDAENVVPASASDMVAPPSSSMSESAVAAIRRRKKGGTEIPVSQDPMAPASPQRARTGVVQEPLGSILSRSKELSSKALRQIALERGIDVSGAANKAQVISALKQARQQTATAVEKTPLGRSGINFAERVAARTSPREDIGNAMRQAAAGADFSNGLRQGALTIRHGRQYLRSAASAYKALGDEQYAFSRMDDLRAKDRRGLFLGNLPGESMDDAARELSRREENYASDLIGNLPFYKQTGRANTLFLNEQRAAIYDLVEEAWTKPNWFNRALSREGDLDALANYINRATGRGTLGPLEGTWISDLLGVGFFSPRYLMSRPQALLNLVNVKNPRVAVEAWKDFGVFMGATTALLGLAKESGLADVELDPTKGDFAKFRVGKVVVDPFAGFQQLARFAARIQSGAWEGDYVAVGKELERFLRTKLAPLPSTIYDLALKDGKDIIGEDVTPGSIAVGLAPIFVQGIIEQAIEGDVGAIVREELPAAALDAIGLGTQVYENVALRRDQLATELYNADYSKLSPMRQAEVNAKLIEKGVEIDTSSRRGPWWSARDAALEMAGAENPIVAKFDSYEEWQDFWYEQFESEGLDESQWLNELTKINNRAGITDWMQDFRKLAVKSDPGIVDALKDGGYSVPKYILEALEESK